MGVPPEIRSVDRPVNTVVVDSGSSGPLRYAVRERKSSNYRAGVGSRPINGSVVGHIYNGQFVPVSGPIAATPEMPHMMSYGAAALVFKFSGDLFSDLKKVFPLSNAIKTIAIACLKVLRPGVTLNRLATHYNRTWISVFYPHAALSKNTASALLREIGEDCRKRWAFFELRVRAAVCDHHIAIDGMLKQDSSSVNDLSAYSYKAAVADCRQISVLYAFDIELMEPICAEVFPGNVVDSKAYAAFIKDNDIRKGIIIDDKGFPSGEIAELLKERPDLHFMTPLKRSDKRIRNNEMLDFRTALVGMDENILYRKKQIRGGRCLYSFKDTALAAEQETAYVARSKKKKDGSAEDYLDRKDFFGVIVFESDIDLDPLVICLAYHDRWQLEDVFDMYKNDLEMDKTNVQDDYSVIGNEFVNFISTVITCRILKKARQTGLFRKYSYRELMEDLNSAWRMTDAPAAEAPVTHDAYWVHVTELTYSQMEKLGICQPEPKGAPKKPGRKPKTAPRKKASQRTSTALRKKASQQPKASQQT